MKSNNNYWETGVCPKCGHKLLTNQYNEYRDCSELIPFYEKLTEWYCRNCGWNDTQNYYLSK